LIFRPALSFPKPAAVAIANAKKPLSGFGFSRTSATFYFEDGSWYKTQLYGEQWPDIDALFDAPCFPGEVPDRIVRSRRRDRKLQQGRRGSLSRRKAEDDVRQLRRTLAGNGPTYGATYEVPGLQGKHSFSAKLLRLIEPVCQSIDYTSADDRAFFMGGNVRGVIMKRSKPEPPPPPPSL
jgi:hypothetical protein